MEEEKQLVVSQQSKPTDINYILSFKAIQTFISALNEEFGEQNKPLRLYNRLIEQTTFSHDQAIKKHVNAFSLFCVVNRDSIYTKKHDFVDPEIIYSENVKLDIGDIFIMADMEQRKIMWQHILTISALVDTSGRAKQILKELNDNSNETNFLTNIIEKIESNVNINQTQNPMEAVGQIMSSGVFTDLLGSMNSQISSGQLDMNKMMNVVQNMVGVIKKDQPEMGNFVDGLMNNLNTKINENE